MNSKLNNVLNELNKQPQDKWADYGTVDRIFENCGTDWNDVNDMFGSPFDELLTILIAA